MCSPLFPAFLQSSLAPLSCMQSQIPLNCPSMMMPYVFRPLFPQVYAALSILIPGAQCTSCHDCSLIWVHFLFIMPRGTIISFIDLCPLLPSSSFQGSFHLPSQGICVTSSQTTLFFIFLLERRLFRLHAGSSGKMGKMRGGHCWGWIYSCSCLCYVHHMDPMYLLLFFWSLKLILSTATQKHLHPLEGLSSDRWTWPKSSIGHLSSDIDELWLEMVLQVPHLWFWLTDTQSRGKPVVGWLLQPVMSLLSCEQCWPNPPKNETCL